LETKDKRQSKRVNHDIKVRYYFGSNTEPIQVFTEDISSGGIRIHNPFPIDQRYQFPMHIFLDQDASAVVKVIARVAWQRKRDDVSIWEMGLEFVQLDEHDRVLLSQFVQDVET